MREEDLVPSQQEAAALLHELLRVFRRELAPCTPYGRDRRTLACDPLAMATSMWMGE